MQDLRYAVRMLLKTPGFTIAAVLTLALGIGANTTMFSVLNTYLFRALPYPAPGQLVQVYRTSKISQSWTNSVANFLDHEQRNEVFDHMVAFNGSGPSLTEQGRAAERLQAFNVTPGFFPALGVRPLIGRVFAAGEDQPNGNLVVVLSERFWKRRFGGDPNLVGRRIELDGDRVEVIGVMPAPFEHPLLWGSVDLWRPFGWTPAQRANRNNNFLQTFARLKPGVSIEQAQESMVRLAANLSAETSSNRNESLRVAPLQLSMSDDVRRSVMWFTFGLAGFVLLIACANLANLQLVRAMARTREHSIRAALGAARWRLLRQSLVESLVVSVIGGVLSLAVAYAAAQYISRQLFATLPGADVAVDGRVFAFALLCSVLTGLAFGTVPAWIASRTDVGRSLKETGRSITHGSRNLRYALIAGEVAFALILLTGAGLFVRGVQRFAHLDPGWRVDGLVSTRLMLLGPRYATPAQRLVFLDQLETRLRALPGVEHVALSQSQPASGFIGSGGIIVEGRPDQGAELFFEPVSPDYFETFGVRLLAGRAFNKTDSADGQPVVIINEATARRLWPNENPIGKRFARLSNRNAWMEVVGVVNDMRFPARLTESYTRFAGFRPLAQQNSVFVNITLRTTAPPEGYGETLRQVVAGLDPTQPLVPVRSVRAFVDEGLGNVSLLSTLLGAFAALGLTLAAIGIYGVTAYTVVQRTNELGIRMALGAQAHDILRLVMSQGARVIAIGALLGVAGGYAVAQLLAATIPMLPTRDPAAVVVITLVLVGCAVSACYLPAKRATRINPLVALRND